jgi:hypothetical protein
MPESPAITRRIDELWEEAREKRLHPSWQHRFANIFYYPLYRLVKYHNPAQLCREVKWFLQRGKKGWSDRDIWSLDNYLSGWLPDALRRLKETKHGIPSGMFEAEDCDADGNPSEAGMERGEARWDAIMDKMIAGFEADKRRQSGLYEEQLGPYPLYRPEGVSREDWEIAKAARFEQSQELARLDEEVFKQGMALFSLHWQSLWD